MYCETLNSCPRNLNTSKDGVKHAEKMQGEVLSLSSFNKQLYFRWFIFIKV